MLTSISYLWILLLYGLWDQDYKRATEIFPDTRGLVFLAKPLGGRGLVSSDVLRQIQKAGLMFNGFISVVIIGRTVLFRSLYTVSHFQNYQSQYNSRFYTIEEYIPELTLKPPLNSQNNRP